MPTSQNLRFVASVPPDTEFEHPPGAGLVRQLSGELSTAGWCTDEMENWRDVGWSIACRRGSSELEIVVSQIPDGEWMLQVSPCRVAGLLGGWFGRQPSATPAEVHALAVAAHLTLSALTVLGRPRWRWDGFPDDLHSSSEPQSP